MRSRLPPGATRCSSTGRCRPAAARRRRRSAPSTARPTSRCTSTSAFFDELRHRFGAQGGPFAEAYVIAHEYGHHVQNLLGTNRQVEPGDRAPHRARCASSSRPTATRACGPPRGRDRADREAHRCRHHRRSRRRRGSRRRPHPAGLTGEVDRESWTHGSARQRQSWFTGVTAPATRTTATRSPPTRCDAGSAHAAGDRLLRVDRAVLGGGQDQLVG